MATTLPGKPTFTVGTEQSCAVTGPAGGTYTDACPVTGATIDPSGWTFHAKLCAVTGTFTTTDAFKTTLHEDSTTPGTYDFVAVLKATHFIPAFTISGYTVKCALSWVGSNGLTWGARHLAPNTYRLHVHNGTARRHRVYCRVTYQTTNGATKHLRWWPRVPAGATARKRVAVHRVTATHCTYRLRHTLTATG